MVILLDDLKKSPNDKKSYRALKLDNGLTVLLISDLKYDETEELLDSLVNDEEEIDSSSETETNTSSDEEDDDDDKSVSMKKPCMKLSAAALCVGIGSFCDPNIMPGMAHFLEHMVFMGSKKYPEENGFDSFLQENGGSSNAFTDCEHTVFHFDINRNNFEVGLDRLAQFFITPMMSKDSMKRELQAIDSEFDIGKNSDSNRKEQLIGSLTKESHPMGKFMWGNSDSLKILPESNGVDIYKELKLFHHRHYSAPYMTLVVQSKHYLDTLEKWVIEYFGMIPNNNLPKPIFNTEQYQKPFDKQHSQVIFLVKPIKIFHQLEILWPMSSYSREYIVKPLEYIASLIGHEGKGSLLSYLKRRTWALSLFAGNPGGGFESNETCSIFSISIYLTKEGMNHIKDVLIAVFQYVRMLQAEGPCERYYREIQTLAECEFRFKDDAEPSNYVQSLAINMTKYPPSEYISGESLYYRYDAEMIQIAMNYLRPRNCHIFYTTKNHHDDLVPLTEKWFGTQFGYQDIPDDWFVEFENSPIDDSFHIPKPNDYIPSDFELKNVSITKWPEIIINNDFGCLRYKKDGKFNVPRSHAMFHLCNPIVVKSAKNLAIFELYLKLIEENLSEVIYNADIAYLKYGLQQIENGVEISIYGFNHKLHKLFETIIEGFSNFTVDNNLFIAVKDFCKRAYYNSLIKPDKYNTELRLSVLCKPYWNKVEKRAALETITIDDVRQFSQDFIKNLYVTSLVHGNSTVEEAIYLHEYISKELMYKPFAKEIISDMKRRGRVIKNGESIICVENFNKNDAITVLTNYYQHGSASAKDCLIDQLLSHLMEEPVFNILRTKKQLGYAVFVTHRVTNGIVGLSLTVYSQSNKFNVKTLNDCIEEFFLEFEEMLFGEEGETLFENQRQAMIHWRDCEDSNLTEPTHYWWREIIDGMFIFDRKQKEIEVLGEITLDDVKKWFSDHLLVNPKRKKLSVQVLGNPNAVDGYEDDETKLIEEENIRMLEIECINSSENIIQNITYASNIDNFKNDLDVYPYSKISF